MSTIAGIPPQKTHPPAGSSAEAKTSAGLLPLSSLASKYVMAITGMGLTLFVIAHMLGNLQVFLGREVLNHYAHFLKSNPELLWPMRIGLLVLFIVHIVMGINLTLQNQSARPIKYARPRKYEEANVSSRTMLLTGLVILAFVIYHLMHFTITPALTPAGQRLVDPLGHDDVYAMVILGFSNEWIVLTYIVAQLLLGLHLWHAVPSMFQSLGINRPRWQKGLDRVGAAITIIVVGGNILIPTAILVGAKLGHLSAQ